MKYRVAVMHERPQIIEGNAQDVITQLRKSALIVEPDNIVYKDRVAQRIRDLDDWLVPTYDDDEFVQALITTGAIKPIH